MMTHRQSRSTSSPAAIGTDALDPDTDGDGFADGEEVLRMGTDPFDPLDPAPTPVPELASWLRLAAGTAFLGAAYRRRVHPARRDRQILNKIVALIRHADQMMSVGN